MRPVHLLASDGPRLIPSGANAPRAASPSETATQLGEREGALRVCFGSYRVSTGQVRWPRASLRVKTPAHDVQSLALREMTPSRGEKRPPRRDWRGARRVPRRAHDASSFAPGQMSDALRATSSLAPREPRRSARARCFARGAKRLAYLTSRHETQARNPAQSPKPSNDHLAAPRSRKRCEQRRGHGRDHRGGVLPSTLSASRASPPSWGTVSSQMHWPPSTEGTTEASIAPPGLGQSEEQSK